MANEEQSQPTSRSYKARTMEGDLRGKKGSVAVPMPPAPPQHGQDLKKNTPPPAPQSASAPQTEHKEGLQQNKQVPPADLPPIPSTPQTHEAHQKGAPPQELPETRNKKTPPPPPPSQERPQRPSGGSGKRKIFLLGAVALVIVLLIIGQVWWFFIRPDDTPTVADLPDPETVAPEPEPEPEPAPAPVQQTPLIQVGITERLLLPSLSQEIFVSELEAVVNQYNQEISSPGATALVHIVPVVQDGQGERLVALEELSALLSITIPQAVRAHLSEEYTLVLLPPVRADTAACQEAGITREGCDGPRLGIVLNSSGTAEVESAMRAWEQMMVNNLRSIILADFTPTAGSFQQSTSYQNVPIRYRNFPIHTIAVSHTIRGGRVLIGTSMHSIRAMIDGTL